MASRGPGISTTGIVHEFQYGMTVLMKVHDADGYPFVGYVRSGQVMA